MPYKYGNIPCYNFPFLKTNSTSTHWTVTSHKALFKVVCKSSLSPLNNCFEVGSCWNWKPKDQIKNVSESTAHIERWGTGTQPFLLLNWYPQSLLSGEEEVKEGWSVLHISLWVWKYLFTVDYRIESTHYFPHMLCYLILHLAL